MQQWFSLQSSVPPIGRLVEGAEDLFDNYWYTELFFLKAYLSIVVEASALSDVLIVLFQTYSFCTGLWAYPNDQHPAKDSIHSKGYDAGTH